MKSKMVIEYVDIQTIKSYSKNAKIHSKSQIEKIAKSIEKFGWKQNLVIDKGGVLVAGHGRYEAAKLLGLKEVPCVRADDLTEDEIRAYRLIDNEIAKGDTDWDLFNEELDKIEDVDMDDFDIVIPDIISIGGMDDDLIDKPIDDRPDAVKHNVFENQELMQFPITSFYGMPNISPTRTIGDKFLRFRDWKECDNPQEYIAHFYYDDYKFIAAWRDPQKYLDRLRNFKAVISPDFSLYTDFPRALQILSCYRRQWCGAYWNHMGIDVIPDVVWGDKESYSYCFDGIPKYSTVAVSSVGVVRDPTWNNDEGDLFKAGYNEMLNRLKPTKILYYGDMIDGLDGDIICIPSYYAEKRAYLNEKARIKKERENGKRNK